MLGPSPDPFAGRSQCASGIPRLLHQGSQPPLSNRRGQPNSPDATESFVPSKLHYATLSQFSLVAPRAPQSIQPNRLALSHSRAHYPPPTYPPAVSLHRRPRRLPASETTPLSDTPVQPKPESPSESFMVTQPSRPRTHSRCFRACDARDAPRAKSSKTCIAQGVAGYLEERGATA